MVILPLWAGYFLLGLLLGLNLCALWGHFLLGCPLTYSHFLLYGPVLSLPPQNLKLLFLLHFLSLALYMLSPFPRHPHTHPHSHIDGKTYQPSNPEALAKEEGLVKVQTRKSTQRGVFPMFSVSPTVFKPISCQLRPLQGTTKVQSHSLSLHLQFDF